jgi:hypothetical protein
LYPNSFYILIIFFLQGDEGGGGEEQGNKKKAKKENKKTDGGHLGMVGPKPRANPYGAWTTVQPKYVHHCNMQYLVYL